MLTYMQNPPYQHAAEGTRDIREYTDIEWEYIDRQDSGFKDELWEAAISFDSSVIAAQARYFNAE